MRAAVPPRDSISPDVPLRLSIAAALAFPDGSLTAAGLRREAARGRLVIERIAGKDYTTLANIERMREQCRVDTKVHTYGCGPEKETVKDTRSGGQGGSSSIAEGISPQDALRAKLRRRKPN